MFFNVLFILPILTVTCAPVHNITKDLNDAVIEKCPQHNATLTALKTKPPYKYCADWNEISKVTNVTEGNTKHVKCLMFFDSITHYCTSADHLDTNYPRNEFSKFTIEDVCSYFNNNTELKKILGGNGCRKVCEDELGGTDLLCQLSLFVAKKLGTNVVPTPASVVPQPKTSDNMALKAGKPKLSSNATVDFHVIPNKFPLINNSSNRAVGLVKKPVLKSPQPNVTLEVKLPNQPSVDEKGDNAANQQVKTTVKQSSVVEKQNNKATQEVKTVKQSSVEDQEDTNQQVEPGKNVDINMDFESDIPDVENNAPSETVDDDSKKPLQLDDAEPVNYATEMEGDSYFFTYFMVLCIIVVLGYVCYHNKQKFLALILEGRRGRRQYRSRRPNSANYHKLDSNLEEAITSACDKNTNQVIY